MEYGQLLSRSWNIIWRYKFLILLGVVVALGSGIGSSTSGGGSSIFQWDGHGPSYQYQVPDYGPFGGSGRFSGFGVPLAAVVLGILGLGVVLVIWAISTLGRGSLIAGAAAADGEGVASLGQAVASGWERVWTLLGIGVLPAIPGLILLLGGVGSYLLATGIVDGTGARAMNAPLAIMGVLGCITLPLILVLGLLRTFANRACMLEGTGVLESYGRGFRVLTANFGSALLLFLLQVAVSILVGLGLFVPGLIMALCCILWPVLLLFEGVMAAFFSTMWTLAWREWTGAALVADETLGL